MWGFVDGFLIHLSSCSLTDFRFRVRPRVSIFSFLFKLIDLHLRLFPRTASFFRSNDGLVNSISLLIRCSEYAIFVAVVHTFVLHRFGCHHRDINVPMARRGAHIVLQELLSVALNSDLIGELGLRFDIQTISDYRWLLQNIQLLLGKAPVDSCCCGRLIEIS